MIKKKNPEKDTSESEKNDVSFTPEAAEATSQESMYGLSM